QGENEAKRRQGHRPAGAGQEAAEAAAQAAPSVKPSRSSRGSPAGSVDRPPQPSAIQWRRQRRRRAQVAVGGPHPSPKQLAQRCHHQRPQPMTAGAVRTRRTRGADAPGRADRIDSDYDKGFPERGDRRGAGLLSSSKRSHDGRAEKQQPQQQAANIETVANRVDFGRTNGLPCVDDTARAADKDQAGASSTTRRFLRKLIRRWTTSSQFNTIDQKFVDLLPKLLNQAVRRGLEAERANLPVPACLCSRVDSEPTRQPTNIYSSVASDYCLSLDALRCALKANPSSGIPRPPDRNRWPSRGLSGRHEPQPATAGQCRPAGRQKVAYYIGERLCERRLEQAQKNFHHVSKGSGDSLRLLPAAAVHRHADLAELLPSAGRQAHCVDTLVAASLGKMELDDQEAGVAAEMATHCVSILLIQLQDIPAKVSIEAHVDSRPFLCLALD
uniref:PCIF1_WW domain-containing protein n=1 Tax=Macrostomum lignano TaxID=282301 RepID=A0A1I8F558_9PLAT